MKNSRIPPESRIVSDQRSYPKKITLSPDVWGLDALHYLRFDPKSSKSFFPLSSNADFWSGGGAIRVTGAHVFSPHFRTSNRRRGRNLARFQVIAATQCRFLHAKLD
ncbi:hypothetical protein [Paraburkholderia graminis]|uniref:Uncharacterized protein n=1 Tax=Paraburkholderia graminis TaxID=60548 RepID=A0ABD5C884_9BURK|nr:hypothetical protein [Paraburkholderia graminis]MDR6201445.1 hypothetical protein [Paraburkholderia graminis]